MDIVRFHHARARGAQFQFRVDSTTNSKWTRWSQEVSAWSPLVLAEELKQGCLRIDPDCAELEYGPLSRALLEEIKYGPTPVFHRGPELVAAEALFRRHLRLCNKGKQLTKGWVSPLMLFEVCQMQYSMFAEYLADQGM